MKKIGIVTTTRAEFGLLLPVIKELRLYENNDIKIELIVSGTHLSDLFGNTINEISEYKVRIDEIVQIPVVSNNAIDISHNQAITIESFTKLFLQKKYCGVVLLGDRYEMLAIAISAGNTLTPIFHLCGGDTTEGAIDEWIRHSITKISYLHFPTNKVSYQRILQLGESPDRVFNYGSTSIDNILENAKMTKAEALSSIGLSNCKYAICTYHPVTMEENDANELLKSLFKVIKNYPNVTFIVTKSNADNGGAKINELLDKASIIIKNMYVYSSLGMMKYLSLIKYAEFVLGNSSSGIIEAPALKIPTINVGDRQRGRLQAKSIINCKDDSDSIISAIDKAMSKEFKKICSNATSPYGKGCAAKQISEKIIEVVNNQTIDLKKKFYDIEEII